MEKPIIMNKKNNVDILLLNGNIYTADRGNPNIRNGAIAIQEGAIEAVGPQEDIVAKYQSNCVVDARGNPVHPGFADTHLHFIAISLHGLPHDFTVNGRPDYGLTETEDALPSYSRLKLVTDDESTYALGRASAIALMRRGFTSFMEAGTVFETDALAEALVSCGMRGMVSAPYGWDNYEEFFACGDYAYANNDALVRAPSDTDRVLKQIGSELRRNSDANALVQGYVCLYGMGTGSDELIRGAAAMARDNDVLFYQHQNPDRQSVETEFRLHGERGLERLDRLDVLRQKTTLSHMNILNKDEADIVFASKPGISWCPYYSVHMGAFPNDRLYFPTFYKAGLDVSLGSDVPIADSIGTMGSASLLLATAIGDRLLTSDPFYMQTIGAANCMGQGERLGSIARGKRADIVIRDTDDIMQSMLDDHGRLLALDTASLPVDTVIIDGRIVMRNRRMTTVDQDEVLECAIVQRNSLFERAAA